MTRKRLLGGLAAVVTAVLLVVGTVWTMRVTGPSGPGTDSGVSYPADPGEAAKVSATDIHDVSVAVDVPTYDFGVEGDGDYLSVTVDNGFGKRLPGVVMNVIIEDPGGDFPAMNIADFGGSCYVEYEADAPEDHGEDSVDEECLRAQREGKEGCTLSPYGDGDRPRSRHARCVHSLDTGENRFTFAIRTKDDISAEHAASVRGYPDLKVSATLSVGERVFAAGGATLKSKYPKNWDQVVFKDFPGEVRADQTQDDAATWSVTVTNGSGENVKGDIGIQVKNHEYFRLATPDSRCGFVDDEPKYGHLNCTGIAIPVGGSYTVELKLFSTGDVDRIEKSCDKNEKCPSTTVMVWAFDETDGAYAEGASVATMTIAD